MFLRKGALDKNGENLNNVWTLFNNDVPRLIV